MGAVPHLVLLPWAAAPHAAGTVTSVVGEVLALPVGEAGRLSVDLGGDGAW
jgi:hypothetical protein